MAPMSRCLAPSCSVLLLRPGRCKAHSPRAFRGQQGNRHARGYGSRWEAARAQVLREEATCVECGGPGLPDDQVDHRRARHLGGSEERSNLRRIHKACHARKTRHEAGAARARKAAGR